MATAIIAESHQAKAKSGDCFLFLQECERFVSLSQGKG